MSLGYDNGPDNLSPREKAFQVLFWAVVALLTTLAGLSAFR